MQRLAGPGWARADRSGPGCQAAIFGAEANRNTLLRLATALAERGIGVAPQIVGVRDFVLRKGSAYRTALMDVAAREAIDLLPDREARTLSAWLKAHPDAQVTAGTSSAPSRRSSPASAGAWPPPRPSWPACQPAARTPRPAHPGHRRADPRPARLPGRQRAKRRGGGRGTRAAEPVPAAG